MATLFVVGIGPGGPEHLTPAARQALDQAEMVIGYRPYLDLIGPLLEHKELVSSGMRQEVTRCRQAIEWAAAGKAVALVSSGDSGIYGMAGLVLQLLHDEPATSTAGDDVEVVVVPGISAVQAAAAVLGAPLMHDFAVISLSDLLTPWEVIERRLSAAAAADFVVALYNPRSAGRVKQLEIARSMLLRHRPSDTPVGIVRHACRPGEERTVTTLGELLDHDIDMFSLVIIGNGSTFVDRNRRMVTPRGYRTRKEETVEAVQAPPPPPHPGAVMFCGTGSDVGKSVLTAGFCRILANRGIRVAPFKSQNMALNSAVTPEGGEIGRAQAVQAEACRIPPHTDMNPVLLKPSSDTGSQVIVQGKVVGNMRVAEYTSYKPTAFASIRESYRRLRETFEFVVMEGAGSIAEINLKAHDIANLKVAEMAGCRAVLVADIDRGGVFAQIIGTIELLTESEREMIGGVIINKFRGDPALLTPGITFIEERTGIPILGVVPYFTGFRIPEEDSVALARRATRPGTCGRSTDKVHIGVVKLPRISNYTDFEPFETDPDVELRYLDGPKDMHGLDLLIIPGSKSTTTDLFFLMERGFFRAVQEFTGMVIGICGGYQMLGHKVLDPLQIESHISEAKGLGLLDVETSMRPEKSTHLVTARLASAGESVVPGVGDELFGYEIHMGETLLGPGARPFATVTRNDDTTISDGAVSADGCVFGTYLHGIFHNGAFRSALLNQLREKKGLSPVKATAAPADPFDQLARHLEEHLDMEQLFRICGIAAKKP